VEYGGRGINTAAQRLSEKYGPGLEVWDEVSNQFVRVPEVPLTAADRKAAELLTDAAGDTNIQRSIGLTALANRQGVPMQLGTSTPRMTALTEKVAGKPSSGQEDLISNLVETRIATPERVSEKVESALPGAKKDYFGEEEAISKRLRSIGDNEYQRAFAVGEVNDPEIMSIINNPSPIIRSIWQSVQNTAQIANKELRMAMEPVLDAGGNLVGLAPTKNAVPDVETLDLFKRALDDRIQKGFRGTGSEGKFEADALKELRNNMVKRLDFLVPEYGAARKKYAGDLEVRDAMRYGLDIFSRKIRPAELRMKLKDMSEAEKEAVKTGALEAAFRNLEGASGGDLAKKLAGTPEKLQKLKSIMGPQEAKFFERVMQKESQLYQRTGKVTGGSRTAVLSEGMDALDKLIQGGNMDEAVNFLVAGPQGRLAALGRFIANINPRKEFGDQVYTKLSRALSAQKPEELRDVLDMLRRSKSYTDYMTSVKNVASGRAAAVTGATAPSMFEDRSFAPPPPTEVEPDPEALLMDALSSGGLGTAISDGAAADAAAMQEGLAAEEEVPEMGAIMMNGREVQEGADGRMYYVDDNTPADGISLGMYRGGTVQAFNKGGNKGKAVPVSYAGNVGRSILEGLTFNNAGELEAAARAYLLRQGDYRDLKADVERDYSRFKSRNPGAALAGELGGAIVPGVVGAFVPGGQGATLSTLGRVGRAMAEPVTVVTRRLMPSAGVRLQRALPYMDEGLTGIIQSIGSADTMADAPRRIVEDAPYNIAGSLGVRGINVGIKKGASKIRAKKKATGGLAVKKSARK
jgi:hypothetical protein